MFIFVVLLNFYFRIFVFFINSNNIWHWRIPAQGLANEIVAASLFYLFLKILWLIIPYIRVRKFVFLVFIIAWSAINYINHEFASVFNTLLPMSWFKEAQNVTAMDSGMDLLKGLYNWQFLLQVIIPVAICIIAIRLKPSILFERPKLRYLILIFLTGSFMQSMTLFPDIQPSRHSIVQSHLLKYWYYESRDNPLAEARKAPLPVFSETFKRIVLEPARSDRNMLPVLKNKQRNVVIVMLESFRAYEVGAYGATLGITPNFDRYAKKGILFKNIYSAGFMTRYGIWSILCGAHRHKGLPVLTDFRDHAQICMTDILAEQGYDNWWFHGQSASYDFQGYFFKRHQVHHIMDRLTFPQDAKVMGWGLADEDLVYHALAQLKNTKTPFFWLVQSQTNHHPYIVPEAFQKYNSYTTVMNGFFNALNYTDHALGIFLDNFLKTPQGKNSLIVVVADHGLGVQLYDPKRFPEKSEMIQYNVPLLILFPEDEGIKPQVVTEIGGQSDILPTLLDMLQIENSNPVFGRSLVRDYKYRFSKSITNVSWLMTEDKVYYEGPPKRVVGRNSKQMEIKAEDEMWFDLVREIDDVQDWMIRQKKPDLVRLKLQERGWRIPVPRQAGIQAEN